MKVSDIEGVVLKSIKYQNSSLIGEIYTADYGLKTFIVKGVTSPKNAYKRILFRPPQIVLLTAYLKEGKDINLLSDLDASHIYQSLHNNIKKGTISLFYIEVFRKVVYDSVVNPELYDFLRTVLIALDKTEFRSIQIIQYMAELSRHIGIAIPQPTSDKVRYFDLLHGEFTLTMTRSGYCLNEQETTLLRRYLQDISYSESYNNTERKQLFNIYLNYFKLQVDNFQHLRSPEIIRDVLLSS